MPMRRQPMRARRAPHLVASLNHKERRTDRMDHSHPVSRIVYPTFPTILTDEDLGRLFTVTPEEQFWAFTVARRGPSLIALLTQLKVFQQLGRFLSVAELPRAAIDRIGGTLSIEVPETFDYDPRTLYHHHRAIREFLHITPWGPKAREVAMTAIAAAAEARLDPADLINAAIDALIRERYELPLLSRLRLLAGTAHRLVNTSQWNKVYERLSAKDRRRLDALLTTREG